MTIENNRQHKYALVLFDYLFITSNINFRTPKKYQILNILQNIITKYNIIPKSVLDILRFKFKNLLENLELKLYHLNQHLRIKIKILTI